MVQSAIVKKQIKEGVVEVSLLRQVECGLSCGGNCAGLHAEAPGRAAGPGQRPHRHQAGGAGGGGALCRPLHRPVGPGVRHPVRISGPGLPGGGWPWDWARGPRWGLRPWACWWVFCPPCGSTAGSPAARSRSLSSCATRRKAVDACSAMSGLSGRN